MRILRNQSHRKAFTLIELILVMVLLIVVVSLVTPALSGFFAGRELDSEAHRFLSLAQYGQERAVSEGIPMFLWIDPQAGAYGLEIESGYTTGADSKAVDYTVSEKLKMNVDRNTAKAPLAGKKYGVHFSPDGTIVNATSVPRISFQEGNHPVLWIGQSFNGMTYQIQNTTLANAR